MVNKSYNLKKYQTILIITFILTCFNMFAEIYNNDSLTTTKIKQTSGKETIVRYKYISVVDHKEAYIDVLVPKF